MLLLNAKNCGLPLMYPRQYNRWNISDNEGMDFLTDVFKGLQIL